MSTNDTGGRKVAALLGASGATGQHLLPLLLADARYGKVITVSRRPLGLEHPRLEQRCLDFAQLADCLAGARVDDAYCTFGTTLRKAGSQAAMTRIDHDCVIEFARAAAAAGARRFAYLSAANANPRSPVYYARLKGGTEQALQAMGFSDLAIYRPSMIVAERSDRRLAESMLFPLLPLTDRLLFGAATRYRSVPVATLARAIAGFGAMEGCGHRILHWQDFAAIAAPAR
ncbi:MAG: NAD(P)H-binding protein [Rhodocyclales bacterium]|nr:NAD(P)H-binding protein [Rhodocyclales bacterium]